MEIIVADQIIMGLILNAGDAKQHIYQALSYAKEGDFTSSEGEIAKADAALLEAHNLQTQFLAQEAGGTKTNMKVAAKELGIDAEIDAYSQAKLADFAPEIDVALLGPQVAYTLDKSKAICEANHIPIAVIPMADYGMLDGKKVLNLALELLGEK